MESSEQSKAMRDLVTYEDICSIRAYLEGLRICTNGVQKELGALTTKQFLNTIESALSALDRVEKKQLMWQEIAKESVVYMDIKMKMLDDAFKRICKPLSEPVRS